MELTIRWRLSYKFTVLRPIVLYMNTLDHKLSTCENTHIQLQKSVIINMEISEYHISNSLQSTDFYLFPTTGCSNPTLPLIAN